MTSNSEMAGGDNDPRRVSTGADRRAEGAGQGAAVADERAVGAGQNGVAAAAAAPTELDDPSARWLEGFFEVKVQADRLQDGTMIPCVMLGSGLRASDLGALSPSRRRSTASGSPSWPTPSTKPLPT